jgi:hypothetical protein
MKLIEADPLLIKLSVLTIYGTESTLNEYILLYFEGLLPPNSLELPCCVSEMPFSPHKFMRPPR